MAHCCAGVANVVTCWPPADVSVGRWRFTAHCWWNAPGARRYQYAIVAVRRSNRLATPWSIAPAQGIADRPNCYFTSRSRSGSRNQPYSLRNELFRRCVTEGIIGNTAFWGFVVEILANRPQHDSTSVQNFEDSRTQLPSAHSLHLCILNVEIERILSAKSANPARSVLCLGNMDSCLRCNSLNLRRLIDDETCSPKIRESSLLKQQLIYK
jgi:hypothetical protein